ncbi:MAG TPA: flavodoxin domain-containing protein [Anaerovoracaceae bacterium]|nr:flavodoxin domain-containing protein [Anaerovoracaceae bacterium]
MPNTVVVYKSKYGSTKKYAEWIAEALQADLFEASGVNADNLLKYDTVIYGGGLYAGGIIGVSLIRKAFDRLRDKKLVLFTVGLADPKNTEQFLPILNKNLTEEMQKAVRIFHFRGSIDYAKISPVYRAAMKFMKSRVEKKDEKDKNDEDRAFLETFGKSVDFTDQASIAPLVDYCRNCSVGHLAD